MANTLVSGSTRDAKPLKGLAEDTSGVPENPGASLQPAANVSGPAENDWRDKRPGSPSHLREVRHVEHVFDVLLHAGGARCQRDARVVPYGCR